MLGCCHDLIFFYLDVAVFRFLCLYITVSIDNGNSRRDSLFQLISSYLNDLKLLLQQHLTEMYLLLPAYSDDTNVFFLMFTRDTFGIKKTGYLGLLNPFNIRYSKLGISQQFFISISIINADRTFGRTTLAPLSVVALTCGFQPT